MTRKIVLLIFLFPSAFLEIGAQDLPAYSFGCGYSGLEYGLAEGNGVVFEGAQQFSLVIPDHSNKIVKAEIEISRKKNCPGFFAGWELLLFKGWKEGVVHGTDFLVSYQKDRSLESTVYGLGYFLRVFPSQRSLTGFSAGFHFFPLNKFRIEPVSISHPDSGNYFFDGRDFGDTVSVRYEEIKTAFCPELSFHLGFWRKFELRLGAGYFFSVASRERMTVGSEDGREEYKNGGRVQLADGSRARLPILQPGYFLFRIGLYSLSFTGKKTKT